MNMWIEIETPIKVRWCVSNRKCCVHWRWWNTHEHVPFWQMANAVRFEKRWPTKEEIFVFCARRVPNVSSSFETKCDENLNRSTSSPMRDCWKWADERARIPSRIPFSRATLKFYKTENYDVSFLILSSFSEFAGGGAPDFHNYSCSRWYAKSAASQTYARKLCMNSLLLRYAASKYTNIFSMRRKKLIWKRKKLLYILRSMKGKWQGLRKWNAI